MKWEKKGMICNSDTLDLSWYKKNTMVPVPLYLGGGRLRVFITMCDSENIGRIGYIDVNAENPSEIIDYSQVPVVDIGRDGCFDDNGVVTSSVLQDGDSIYLYYSGYQLCSKIPYMIFSGVAISVDNADSFQKISSHVPMLDRVDGEVSTRCAPFVIRDGDTYKMWYTADAEKGWIEENEKKLPLYDLKYSTSDSPIVWPAKAGRSSVTFANNDEHGIAKCTLWKEDGVYKIIYSIRSLSQGYRLGYGESVDGEAFVRKDDLVGISVSEKGWDSEMIAFAERINVNNKTYLFYCGNHYGMGGVGYAEFISEQKD